MRILAITDSHHSFEEMVKLGESENFDCIIFAGDCTKDIEDFSYIYENIPYYIVKGNTDVYDLKSPTELEFNLKGYKIFLTHGHHYKVKSGYEELFQKSKKIDADICVFGHTHKKFYGIWESIHFFNPGALCEGYYGIIEITNSGLKFEHKQM